MLLPLRVWVSHQGHPQLLSSSRSPSSHCPSTFQAGPGSPATGGLAKPRLSITPFSPFSTSRHFPRVFPADPCAAAPEEGGGGLGSPYPNGDPAVWGGGAVPKPPHPAAPSRSAGRGAPPQPAPHRPSAPPQRARGRSAPGGRGRGGCV